MKGYIIIIGVIIIFIAGGVLLKKQNTPKEVVQQVQQTETPVPQQRAQVKEITMTAKQWEFVPSEVRVKVGEPVKIIVKSVDVKHGIAIVEFNVKADLEPGKDTIVEFTPNKKGEFTFFCDVLCGQGHKDMKGKLIVE